MAVTVTTRAIEVLRRALEAGRLDTTEIGIRVSLARGLKGEEVRTGFAEGPEQDEHTIEASGLRLFIPAVLAERDITIDVADEHERIIIR